MGITEKRELEFRLKDGNCRLQAVRDNIIRCSFTKKEEWREESPVGISCSTEGDFAVEEDGGRVRARTGEILLEADQRDGSFCEYVAMPVERIYEGKGLSAKELALVEPFTISYHAVNRAPVKAGDKVLVVGAGPIGLFALIAAINKGAEVYVADILDGRLEKALDFGAKGVINSAKTDIKEEAMKITGGDGFDCCIEACGQSVTFLNCIDCCAFAGKIILIGNGKKETTFLHSILLKKELNVYGSRNSYPSDFKDVIDLISSGKVDVLKMVSDIYPMDRADEAFKALANNKGDLCKVLVKIGD